MESNLRAARLAVSLCFILNGGLYACWVSRIPAVQEALGLNHARLGVALFAASAAALVSMPLTGWCVTRYGSRAATRVAAVLYCLSLPLMGLATNLLWLAAALLVYGGFYGAFDVAMNSQAVAVEERLGRPVMSSFHALYSAGGLAGAALGGQLAGLGVSPLAHFVGGAILLGVLALAIAWPRLLPTTELERQHAAESSPLLEWRRPPARLIAMGALAFCIMMGEGSMADWSAIYLREAGATEAAAAAGFAAFSITMAAMRFCGDFLSARLGAVRLVQAGATVAAVGLTVALVLGHVWPALIGFGAVGLGFSIIVPQVFSAAGRTPGMPAGPAIATATTIGYTGFLLGPPIIGFIADHTGLRLALFVIVGVSLIALALAPSLRREA